MKSGVEALGDVCSKGRGMNHVFAISIYVLLGYKSFAMMMKSIFEQEVGEESTEDFFVKLRHATQYNQKIKDNSLEHYQNN